MPGGAHQTNHRHDRTSKPISTATSHDSAATSRPPAGSSLAASAAAPLVSQRRATPGWPSVYRRRLFASDVLSGFAAAFVASVIRWGVDIPARMIVVGLLIPLAWCVCVGVLHGYNGRLLGAGPEEYRSVANGAALLLGVVGFASFAFELNFSRAYVIALALSVVAFGLVSRKVLRTSLVRSRARGRLQQRTVVVGTVASATELITELREGGHTAFDIVGVCVPAGSLEAPVLKDIPVIGDPRDVLFAVDFADADVVAVSGNAALSGRQLRELGWELEERQIELVVSPGVFQVAGPRLALRPHAGVSLLHVERPMHSGVRRVLKAVTDRALALLLTVVALPFLLVTAAAIRATSPGPALFTQERVGERGQCFKIYKFRTMVADAEARKAEMTTGHQVNDVLFKDKADPRITRVGAVLRRFSIDELPQLINVMRGEMSLVGPRPGLPEEVAQYKPDALRRLRVRPGMTGMWQVSGRASLDWEQTVRLDLWYVDNWTPLVDLQILFRTAKAVFGGSGAY
ncbi:Exopolysaccharide biosynthesis polyprenyl glycosylphosphotransferase [Nostocoides japonicum T1-X7]|uniref:Exopolysaccharide biosynthesis polyprenyl glycosylphosphotransferase n=1 Tax=Nostocoides japonicum T1-X7 TaxID=1194083 RepID=A0A077LZ60_9MICO|nr:Exopolysaccharide biosynthesis polyprenyl glycosylphosphotransferase [Tetrasphaera japonica T1-X7]